MPNNFNESSTSTISSIEPTEFFKQKIFLKEHERFILHFLCENHISLPTDYYTHKTIKGKKFIIRLRDELIEIQEKAYTSSELKQLIWDYMNADIYQGEMRCLAIALLLTPTLVDKIKLDDLQSMLEPSFIYMKENRVIFIKAILSSSLLLNQLGQNDLCTLIKNNNFALKENRLNFVKAILTFPEVIKKLGAEVFSLCINNEITQQILQTYADQLDENGLIYLCLKYVEVLDKVVANPQLIAKLSEENKKTVFCHKEKIESKNAKPTATRS